jgi:hypothetical protein
MERPNKIELEINWPAPEQNAKKRYRKPSFRQERIFETMALSCGKVQTTQGSCAHNRKAS